jgi:replication-associated recombination protein RarA
MGRKKTTGKLRVADVARSAQRAIAASIAPDDYKPAAPSDLIGGARGVATIGLREAEKLAPQSRAWRLLIHGEAGSGKTCVAKIIARALAANPVDIEQVDGPNVTAEVIRRWTRDACFASLFGGWKVKLIQECDLVTAAAQDLMLTYLDELPAQTAVIGTSNQSVALLTERFQTRFRLLAVASPSSEELQGWLETRWRVPKQQASFIALAACGNVRAALLDAAQWENSGTVPERPKVQTSDWRTLRAADIRNQRRSGRSRIAG